MNMENPPRVLVIESSPMILTVIRELAKSVYPHSEIQVRSNLTGVAPSSIFADVVVQNLTGALDAQITAIGEAACVLASAKLIFLSDNPAYLQSHCPINPSVLFLDRVLPFQQMMNEIAKFDSASQPYAGADVPANEFQSRIQYPGADKPLTLRQVQAIELAVQGYTVKQIAREMELSSETVKSHLKQAYERLKARNRSQGICNYLEAKRLAGQVLAVPGQY